MIITICGIITIMAKTSNIKLKISKISILTEYISFFIINYMDCIHAK